MMIAIKGIIELNYTITKRGIELEIDEILKRLCHISGLCFTPNYDKEDIQSEIEELIQDIKEGLDC